MSQEPAHPCMHDYIEVMKTKHPDLAKTVLEEMGYEPLGDGTYVHRDFMRLIPELYGVKMPAPRPANNPTAYRPGQGAR